VHISWLGTFKGGVRRNFLKNFSPNLFKLSMYTNTCIHTYKYSEKESIQIECL